MPETFDNFGLRFLYPENWEIAERNAEGESVGVTFETPEGAFFSINRYPDRDDSAALLRRVEDAMHEEYESIEYGTPREWPDRVPGEIIRDLHFYVFDLLVISRLVVIPDRGDLLLVQIQGESRDFDKQEPVFAAILTSLRQHLREKADQSL